MWGYRNPHFQNAVFALRLQVVRNHYWRVFEEAGVERSRVGNTIYTTYVYLLIPVHAVYTCMCL